MVDNIDELVKRLLNHGVELIGDLVNYENTYCLCYVRGTEGILIGLAEELNKKKKYNEKE